MSDPDKKHWMSFLEDEDVAFVKRFILFSGSLKDLADAYNVSYPTLRLRLDRLIEKIKILDSQKIDDDFERQLRAHFADGNPFDYCRTCRRYSPTTLFGLVCVAASWSHSRFSFLLESAFNPKALR